MDLNLPLKASKQVKKGRNTVTLKIGKLGETPHVVGMRCKKQHPYINAKRCQD